MQTYALESLGQLFRNNAESAAQSAALIQPDALSWSYGQLRLQVEELAAALQSLCLTQHDTVAVALPDGALCLVTHLGVMTVCACAPLNPSLTEPELKRDLIELGASALICTPKHTEALNIAKDLNLLLIHATLNNGDSQWLPLTPTPTTPPPTAKPNRGAAILLHTSATTGRRKIVPLTRANLTAACQNTARSLQLTPHDRLLVLSRLFHAQGILSALSQWSAGGTVILPNSLDPTTLTQHITDLKPTWYTCGPTLHQAILTELRKQPQPRPHSLRFVRSGGNTLPPGLKQSLQHHLGVPVLDMYGLSETGAVAAVSLDPTQPAGWRSVGPEISILSPEGHPLPPGEEGEIAVRGPSVLAGYWNDEAANREAFWPEGWFRTGDLGTLDADGTLTMSGRLKEIINRGGQKIIPTEIDQVLRQHPAVKSVAAFAIPHPTLGEDVACAVVLHEHATATERDLQTHARTCLARFKVPRRIHFLPALPVGATGKPQRLVLRERFGNRPTTDPDGDAWATEQTLTRTEKTIAELWAGQLACTEIRLHDDYFHLGGDSLGAVTMLSEVETLLGQPLPPGAAERFFESPTLQTLANLLSAPHAQPENKSHDLRLYPLLGEGPGLEAFLFPADDEEGWYYRLLSRHLGKQRPLWMLRPESGLYAPGPNQIEATAIQAVELIRNQRPQGPYVIGGFCLGGVIAYETARLLQSEGETVALILFDSPTPGRPHPLRAWKHYLRQSIVLSRSRRYRRAAAIPRIIFNRFLWLILRKLKERGHLPTTRVTHWLRRHAEHDYFPLYRPAGSRIPILHFIKGEGQEPLREASVHAWQNVTQAETTLIRLEGSHHSLFREANLPVITQSLQDWPSANPANLAQPSHPRITSTQ